VLRGLLRVRRGLLLDWTINDCGLRISGGLESYIRRGRGRALVPHGFRLTVIGLW
jgi:hypothetical protein